MDEVAKKIADFCVKNELVEQGMFEWCVYSIEKKLVTFSTWVVLISIGTRLFGFRCTLCFTLGFLVLRRRTNGYHAKTYIKCLIVSLLIECGSIFVVQNISMERLVFIIIFSNLTIFKFAPQQRTNPFDSRRNERNEKGNTQGSHRNGYSMLAVHFLSH